MTKERGDDALVSRFWSKVQKADGDGCWEWVRMKDPDGYGYFAVGRKRAHRVSWELTNGEIPDGLHVLHNCDNRACVRPDHLHLGTHQDNMDEMCGRGRHSTYSGEAHGLSKLTDDTVRHILSSTDTAIALAARLGVHRETVGRIRRGERWKHITGEQAQWPL